MQTLDMNPDLTIIGSADNDDLEAIAAMLDQALEDDEELGALKKKITSSGVINRAANPEAIRALFNRDTRNRTQMFRRLRRLVARNKNRAIACKAHGINAGRRKKITAKDVVGRVLTPTPVFAEIDLKAGALSDTIKGMTGQSVRYIKVFHKGIDDDGAPYGSEVPIDLHRTNLITSGALPDGHVFIGHRIEIEVTNQDRSEVDPADLRIVGEAMVRWGDRNGSSMVDIGLVRQCPATRGIVVAAGNGGAALGVRFGGAPMHSQTPFMSLLGGEKGHEMRLEFPDPSLELGKKLKLRVSLYGKHYQRPSGS